MAPIHGGFSGKAGWTCQKRKRPDHSGLPMRTKRLNYRSQPRYYELFVGCGAAVERLASHTVTCICASTTQSIYQMPCPLPVTSSGYRQLRYYIFHRPILFIWDLGPITCSKTGIYLVSNSKTGLKNEGTPSVTQEFGDGFGPRPDLQFFVNPADIGVDGFVADFEFVGNFLVHQSLAQQVEHLLFALG